MLVEPSLLLFRFSVIIQSLVDFCATFPIRFTVILLGESTKIWSCHTTTWLGAIKLEWLGNLAVFFHISVLKSVKCDFGLLCLHSGRKRNLPTLFTKAREISAWTRLHGKIQRHHVLFVISCEVELFLYWQGLSILSFCFFSEVMGCL